MKTTTTLTALTLAAVTAATMTTSLYAQDATTTAPSATTGQDMPKPKHDGMGHKGMRHDGMRAGMDRHDGQHGGQHDGWGHGGGHGHWRHGMNGHGMHHGMRGGHGPMMGGIDQQTMARFEKIDTNQDGILSPQELRAYEAARVAGLDANKDGFITADEIAAQRVKLETEEMTQKAQARIAALDTDHDGKLSVAEMEARPLPFQKGIDRMMKAGGGKITKEAFDAMQARMEGHGPMMHGDRDGGMKGDMKGGPDKQGDHMRGDHMQGRMAGMGRHHGWKMPSFDEIDANHDGAITPDEIAAFRKGKIEAMDTNHDGFITADEMVAARTAKLKPRAEKQAEMLVKKFDLNGDGKLGVEDLAGAPMVMLFDGVQAGPDGSVSIGEFARAMQVMHMHREGAMHHRRGDRHGPWMKTGMHGDKMHGARMNGARMHKGDVGIRGAKSDTATPKAPANGAAEGAAGTTGGTTAPAPSGN